MSRVDEKAVGDMGYPVSASQVGQGQCTNTEYLPNESGGMDVLDDLRGYAADWRVRAGEAAPVHRAITEIERLRKALAARQPVCSNCNGIGVIGYTTGQTPEQFEQGEYPCPDCAHPSPAGQGDVLCDVANAIWLIRREQEDKCDLDLGDIPRTHWVWDEARAAIAALAARQPVGQETRILAHSTPMREAAYRALGFIDRSNEHGESAYRQLRRALLNDAPPAQAVDLGRLTRWCIPSTECTCCDGDSEPLEDADGEWVMFADVKALIDCQAVGNG